MKFQRILTKRSPAMNITRMLSTLAKTLFLSWNDIKTVKVVRPPFRCSRLPRCPPGKGPKGGNEPSGGAPKAPYKEKNHKFCALLSKMSDLLESSDDGSDEDHENDNNADADDQHDDADDKVKGASSVFFSFLGLAKE
jgi:hypothetical protein